MTAAAEGETEEEGDTLGDSEGEIEADGLSEGD